MTRNDHLPGKVFLQIYKLCKNDPSLVELLQSICNEFNSGNWNNLVAVSSVQVVSNVMLDRYSYATTSTKMSFNDAADLSSTGYSSNI